MSATTAAPQPPSMIDELERQKRDAEAARKAAEGAALDAIRLGVEEYYETGKTNPATEDYYRAQQSPKQAAQFNAESIAASKQHYELLEQEKLAMADHAVLMAKRRTIATDCEEATADFTRSIATYDAASSDAATVDAHCKIHARMYHCGQHQARLSGEIKRLEAEIANLRRAADEIVVLIDPTSQLSPPMNFAIAGGPRQSVKSPFQRAESIKLREDKLAKAKREIDERETKIAKYQTRLAELTQDMTTAQATSGEDQHENLEKIKSGIEFCQHQIREKSAELTDWRSVAAEELRRLELERSA